MKIRDFISIVESIGHAGPSEAMIQEIIEDLQSDRGNYSLDGYYPGGEKTDEEMDEIFRDEIAEAWFNISSLIKGDYLTIYREIEAPPNWDHKLDDRPHIYWAWDKDAAHSHDGVQNQDHIPWILTSRVNVNQINWVETLIRNSNAALKNETEVSLNIIPKIEHAEPRPKNFSNKYY